MCMYIYITLHNFLYFIFIYVYIYTRTHVYMDHQREVSLQTLMALGNLEVVNMSSALLRGKTADAPKPGSKAPAYAIGVIQEPWRNFIIIHTFLYKMDVYIYIYVPIHESSSTVVHMQTICDLYNKWMCIYCIIKMCVRPYSGLQKKGLCQQME